MHTNILHKHDHTFNFIRWFDFLNERIFEIFKLWCIRIDLVWFWPKIPLYRCTWMNGSSENALSSCGLCCSYNPCSCLTFTVYKQFLILFRTRSGVTFEQVNSNTPSLDMRHVIEEKHILKKASYLRVLSFSLLALQHERINSSQVHSLIYKMVWLFCIKR